MNRKPFAAIASGLAVAAIGLSLALTESTGAAASTRALATGTAATGTAAVARETTVTGATAAPLYVLLDCASRGQVRPSGYVLACGDGGAGLAGTHWTGWTPQLASAYGTFYENDCIPNCASGHFHNYPALVTAWGSGSMLGHPSERRYTELTLIFTGARPPVYKLVNGGYVATYPLTQTFPAS